MSASPRILVTAGPTHEPIDAVRYLANRSSGRLGIAIAADAARRGWPTTLLLGPVSVEPPQDSQVRIDRFRTTADLQRLLISAWPDHDVLVMAAAVSDFRPATTASGKLRRDDAGLRLDLEATPDLLASLSSRPDQTVIGFALAEQATLHAVAAEKLRRKRLDAIVANPLETMDADRITATLITASGASMHSPDRSKTEFAAWLLDQLPLGDR